MAYSPTKSDATACATDLAARLTTAGVPVSIRDTLVAMLDNTLCSLGVIGTTDQAGPSVALTQSSSTPQNFGTALTVTAPIAKTYYLHVDLSLFASNIGTANRGVTFTVKVDASTPGGQPTNAMSFAFNVANKHERLHFIVPLTLTTGSHTLQMQWAALNSAVLGWNSDDCLNMTLIGG